MLWFNLILDFNFSFLCLWHSCVGKVPFSDCIKFFFSSTKRGYKCTLVQSKNWFNLQYRQSFFFNAEQHRELQEVVHAWPGHLTQVCKTCQGFDWCKLDPRYIVWLILTLKCSEHVFKILISYCCFHKNDNLYRLAANLKDCGAYIYVTGWANTKPPLFLFTNKPMVMCLH